MHIQFLGTSSGSPSHTRNMSATAVSFDTSKQWVLVDCAEATQHQLLKSNLSVHKLSVICITHCHGDHCYGLPGLLAALSMSGRTEPVHLIAPQKVIHFVAATRAMTSLTLPFDLVTHAIEAVKGQLDFALCAIDIIALKHRVPSYAFKITEKGIPNKLKIAALQAQGIASGPHYNQLQKGLNAQYQGKTLKTNKYTYPSWRPRRVIVSGDNEKPALLKAHCEDIDMLVHEATFTHADLHRVGLHTGHSDAKRVAKFAQKCAIPRLVLTHFSVRYHGPNMLDKLEQEARMHFSGELHLAQDFDTLTISKHLSE